jgi:glycerophosphoryl diester phosphodiesterase
VKIWGLRILTVLMFALVGLTFLNASWLAPPPKGSLSLVAHRGVYQNFDRVGLGRDDCTATRIRKPSHIYLENTIPSIRRAIIDGANMIEIDLSPSKDGTLMLFHDWTLDCRTNGAGQTRDKTVAELKALDIGYGYTADGGKTFPFRGKGIGMMPTLEEVLVQFPRADFLINFKSKNAAEADMVADLLQRMGRNVDGSYAFIGDAAPIARIRQRLPGVWAFAKDEVKACTTDYVKFGWLGIIPESCKGGTAAVPLNYQWAIWGWPKRFLERMDKAGARVIMTGPVVSGSANRGIEQLEEIPKVPRDFRGYLITEEIQLIGPALKP